MDLQQDWTNMDAELNNLSRYTPDDISIRKTSKGLVETLVKNLKLKMIWIRVFSLPSLAGAIFAPGALKLLLLAVFIAYETGRFLSMRKLNKINTHINYTDVTRNLIASQIALIKQMFRIEEIWGYVFIPLAAPAGFFASALVTHRSLAVMVDKLGWGYVLVGYLLITIPCFYLARRMNRMALGKNLKNLEEKLEQLGD